MNSSNNKSHIICERDVGLFSLILQVVANIPWAVENARIPHAYFNDRCVYWTPDGFHGKQSVWEYYFEPLVEGYSVDTISAKVIEQIKNNPPSSKSIGYFYNNDTFITNHFGDHPKIKKKALQIPYKWNDPDHSLRVRASAILHQYIRPRAYLLEKVNGFYKIFFNQAYVIGVHIRGTDAISKKEKRAFRQGMLSLENYVVEIEKILRSHPEAKIFVATDSQASLGSIEAVFGDRVFSFDSIRHQSGEAAGEGPTGNLVPAYIADDENKAAQNGMEAVIESLLLAKTDILLHNGAGLARTVLLSCPSLPHINTYRPNKILSIIKSFSIRNFLINIKYFLVPLLESDTPPNQ